jgi:hypothetical protein
LTLSSSLHSPASAMQVWTTAIYLDLYSLHHILPTLSTSYPYLFSLITTSSNLAASTTTRNLHPLNHLLTLRSLLLLRSYLLLLSPSPLILCLLLNLLSLLNSFSCSFTTSLILLPMEMGIQMDSSHTHHVST